MYIISFITKHGIHIYIYRERERYGEAFKTIGGRGAVPYFLLKALVWRFTYIRIDFAPYIFEVLTALYMLKLVAVRI